MEEGCGPSNPAAPNPAVVRKLAQAPNASFFKEAYVDTSGCNSAGFGSHTSQWSYKKHNVF